MSRDSDGRISSGGEEHRKSSGSGGFWRSLKTAAASPFQAFPKDEVVEGVKLIGSLAKLQREHRRKTETFPLDGDGNFDLRALAFFNGRSVSELEALLWRRRKTTARAAYLAFGLGWLCFIAWVWRAIVVPWSASSWVQALEFLPFLVFFFLAAFWCGLMNFQIRTRRLATAKEYLCTREVFWPH